MKARRKKPRIQIRENPRPGSKIPEGTIQIVCELFRVPVTAAQAAVFERKIREAVREAYPRIEIRGLWVHKGITDTGALR